MGKSCGAGISPNVRESEGARNRVISHSRSRAGEGCRGGLFAPSSLRPPSEAAVGCAGRRGRPQAACLKRPPSRVIGERTGESVGEADLGPGLASGVEGDEAAHEGRRRRSDCGFHARCGRRRSPLCLCATKPGPVRLAWGPHVWRPHLCGSRLADPYMTRREMVSCDQPARGAGFPRAGRRNPTCGDQRSLRVRLRAAVRPSMARPVIAA